MIPELPLAAIPAQDEALRRDVEVGAVRLLCPREAARSQGQQREGKKKRSAGPT